MKWKFYPTCFVIGTPNWIWTIGYDKYNPCWFGIYTENSVIAMTIPFVDFMWFKGMEV
jgi:hypothetical protein